MGFSMEPRIFTFLRLFLNILKSTGFMDKMNFQYLLDFRGKGIQEIHNSDIPCNYNDIDSYIIEIILLTLFLCLSSLALAFICWISIESGFLLRMNNS